MMLISTFLLSLAVRQVLATSEEIIPVLHTGSGAIRGSVQIIADNSVYTFLGIPYAIPPVGELRFKKPRAVRPWENVLDATRKPPACYQHRYSSAPWPTTRDMSEEMSEDCLYLNIWVPQRADGIENRARAVMVWIYGGGFYSGSANLEVYDGAVLAAYGGVVVITLNYRVGVFGFLNAKVRRAPGNMGMLDQRLAFQWIKNNARSFGGDPNRITIIGESAGAVSVGLHLLSPLSRGLFARAIMQSGSPFHPVLKGDLPAISQEKSERFARAVRCSDAKKTLLSHPNDVLACLRAKNASDLAWTESMFVQTFLMWFIPSCEDEFLPYDAITALKEGRFNTTEVLATITSNEGSIFSALLMKKEFDVKELPSLKTEEGKELIRKVFTPLIQNPAPSDIADFYIDGLQDGFDVSRAIMRALGDSFFNCPMAIAMEHFANKGGPIRYYALDHHPMYSPWQPWMAMAHFDDIQYTFGNPLRDSNCNCYEEQELSRIVMTLLTSFAKSGQPTLPDGKSWPEYDRHDRAYLEVKKRQQTIKHGPYTENCDFWNVY